MSQQAGLSARSMNHRPFLSAPLPPTIITIIARRQFTCSVEAMIAGAQTGPVVVAVVVVDCFNWFLMEASIFSAARLALASRWLARGCGPVAPPRGEQRRDRRL